MKRSFVSTALAAAALGVSPKYLREHRDSLFKSGVHYISINPEAWRPTYRWDVDAVAELLSPGDVAAQLDQRLGR